MPTFTPLPAVFVLKLVILSPDNNPVWVYVVKPLCVVALYTLEILSCVIVNGAAVILAVVVAVPLVKIA